VVLSANAPVAAIARIEEREGDAIALLQRPTERVGLDTAPQAVNHPRELVTGHATEIGPLVVAVVAPVMQVRAANRGGGVLDEDASGLDLRRGKRLELERLSGLIENGGQSFRHRDLLVG